MKNLLHKRRVMIAVLAALAALLVVQSALAVDIEATLYCVGDDVIASLDNADWPVQVYYTVNHYGGGTTVISGTYADDAKWNFGPGTVYFAVEELRPGGEITQMSTTCPKEGVPAPKAFPTPEPFQNDVPQPTNQSFEDQIGFTVQVDNADAAKNGIFVYHFVDVVQANGETIRQQQVMASVSLKTLAKLPEQPTENTRLAISKDGLWQIWKLTTGEYQVNIGPDETGLVRVWIWRGLPPTPGEMYRKDYNIYP